MVERDKDSGTQNHGGGNVKQIAGSHSNVGEMSIAQFLRLTQGSVPVERGMLEASQRDICITFAKCCFQILETDLLAKSA